MVWGTPFKRLKAGDDQPETDAHPNPISIPQVFVDRRYRNRELQVWREMHHPNIVTLKVWWAGGLVGWQAGGPATSPSETTLSHHSVATDMVFEPQLKSSDFLMVGFAAHKVMNTKVGG